MKKKEDIHVYTNTITTLYMSRTRKVVGSNPAWGSSFFFYLGYVVLCCVALSF